MSNSNQIVYDLGPALAEHCLKVAAFASDKQNKNGKDEDYLPILLALSTPSFSSSLTKNKLFDSAFSLTTAWYQHMKQKHENVIQERLSKEAEECAEISSLFTTGVCSGRPALGTTELESLFQSAATMCGLPLLMKANFAPYAEALASKTGGAPVSVEKATQMLLRAWADANVDQSWFLNSSSSSSSTSTSTTKLYNISYSVSPDVRLRFRFLSAPLIKSEFTKKQIVELVGTNSNNNNDLAVFRDVVMTFDDDDIMPGESITPLVKKYKEVLLSLFSGAISTQQFQKSLIKLQKLVGDSLSGVLDQNKEAAKLKNTSNQKPSSPTSNLSNSQSQQQQQQSSSTKKASIAQLYTDPENALKDVDLQDAEPAVVQEYKDKMTEGFNENVIKPGDPGYVYDKRVEVNPTGKSEWDDSDDD